MTNRPSRPSLNRDVAGSRFIVVMGVCGTGKSTLGAALAETFGVPFLDGDDLHPPGNVAKMARGVPLEDEDRGPWLEAIRRAAVARVMDQVGERGRGEVGSEGREERREGVGAYEASMMRGRAVPAQWPGVIVACSALKKAYRAVLRGEDGQLPTYFVYLKGEREVLMARMRERQGHFMKAGMLESQLSTLESPEGESGVVTVSVEMSTGEQVQRVVAMMSSCYLRA